MVKVDYEELQPAIFTIEVSTTHHSLNNKFVVGKKKIFFLLQDAINANSYYDGAGRSISRGNVEKGFTESDHVIEGEIKISGQDHFYLETQCALAVPKEEHELEIFSSTQDPTGTQHLVSHILGIPLNRITVKVKRLGGGFGGKESRGMLVSLPVAFAAHRYLLN